MLASTFRSAGRAAAAGGTVLVLALTAVPWPAEAAGQSKTVPFRGFRVTVPADWPVHDVTGKPGCVRFDRSAVYLGDPTRSTCPPRLVGRTQAVHLTTRSLQGVVRPDRVVTSADSRVAVVVSAGRDPAAAREIAASVTYAGGAVDVHSPSGRYSARTFAGTSPAGSISTAGQRAVSAATTFTGQGFDACTARTLSELATWYSASPYKAVNMYIGGASRGCAQPNLNASWVSSVIAQGWVLIPTYVGLQAPCRDYPNRIDPAQAAAQGSAAADDAIVQLNALGLGSGNPVYFDMEAFTYSDTGCRQAVLDFLDAWTAQLHYRGYVSGVYGSAGSTIRALVSQLSNPVFDQPDQLWIARWCTDLTNCDTSTSDPEVPADQWDDHQRIRQYRGGHTETWGGVTINIDSNTVDGAVSPSQLAAEGSFVGISGSSDVYRIAGGAPVFTSSWESVGLPSQPVQPLSPTQFDSLPSRPADGTFLVGAATGRIYRVTNGVGTFVPSWALYGTPQPTTTVDQAALDNAGTGGVWNRLSSGRPSVRTTGPTTLGTVTASTRFTWAGGISSSAVASYDVRWRRARWDGGFGAWTRPAGWQRTANLDAPLGLRPGHTYCVSVRVRNRAGQLSAWTGSRCLTRALDDRRLAATTAGWKARTGSRNYAGTFMSSTTRGAKLARPGAKVARVGVVATVCRPCGVVAVRIDGRWVGQVDLSAPTLRRRQVVMLRPFPREAGTVTVTVRSSGKRVHIDGLVLSRK
ncbi:MAG: DUF1906 domain-containing protein [Sporichthyaceae bacterium]|nr:DUF1906 domain-containing protein [Sporichthyaceae bacterium]